MRFLITNDDGYDAPGLLALREALSPLGEIIVVAPAEQHSSKGHAVATHQSIRVVKRHIDGLGASFVVHSTPADCVRVALRGLLDTPPDFVLAGINPGANLGVDANYSGTVSASREAAILGVPGIAISQYMLSHVPLDWAATTELASTIVAEIIKRPIGEKEFWNVNFPATPVEDRPKPLKYVPMCTAPHAIRFEIDEGDPDTRFFRLAGLYQDRGRTPDSDVEAVFAGHATATRLQLDQTANSPHTSPQGDLGS